MDTAYSSGAESRLIQRSNDSVILSAKFKHQIVIVESYMQQQMLESLIIPEEIDFSDLRLSRHSDGSVSFDLDVIKRIFEISGVSEDIFLNASEDSVAGLVFNWYRKHLSNGGKADPVAEDLIAEAAAEDAAGQPYSFQPGSA